NVLPDLKRLGPRLGKKLPLVKSALGKVDGGKLLAEMEATGKVELKLEDRSSESLDRDDLQVRLEAKSGWAAEQSKSCVVVLDTTPNDQQISRFVARAFIRIANEARKRKGLRHEERITCLHLVSDDLTHHKAINEHRDGIAQATLANEVRY